MQLFLTDLQTKGDYLRITEKRVLHQVKNVLRYRPGDKFLVQSPMDGEVKKRYEVSFENMGKDFLDVSVIKEYEKKIEEKTNGMIVGFLNKYSKMELIVRELSEIGIENIFFMPFERSVLRDFPAKKLQRLEKIKTEAVEQSKSRINPCLGVFSNISELSNCRIVLFDGMGEFLRNSSLEGGTSKVFGLVGPEGGFNEKEQGFLQESVNSRIKLSDNILRSETASVIGGWMIKEHL